MDEILKYLLDKWPFGIWLLIGGAIVLFYFKLKNLSDKANNNSNSAVDRINKLPCDKHKEHIDTQKDSHRDLDLKIEKIDVKMEYISKSIDSIYKALRKDNLDNSLTQTSSPLTLTDKGKQKVEKLGIDKMIDENWERILSLISEKAESKNPYDIQQICIDETILFPDKFISQDDIDKLKLEAYREGDLLQSYMRVIAILVRDRFFCHLGIDVSEVDAHDPEIHI